MCTRVRVLQHERQGKTLDCSQLSIKPAMLASSVQAVVACHVTATRVCTLVLFIMSVFILHATVPSLKESANCEDSNFRDREEEEEEKEEEGQDEDEEEEVEEEEEEEGKDEENEGGEVEEKGDEEDGSILNGSVPFLTIPSPDCLKLPAGLLIDA